MRASRVVGWALAVLSGAIGTADAAKVRIRQAAPGQLERDARRWVLPESAAPSEPKDKLPRVTDREEWTPAAGRPWATELSFDAPRYAINDRAPSWVALYERLPSSGRYRKVKAFRAESLRGSDRIEWPKLELRKGYRVQGTFYFCQGADPKAPCVIQSIDHPVNPAAASEASPPVTVTYVKLKTRK